MFRAFSVCGDCGGTGDGHSQCARCCRCRGQGVIVEMITDIGSAPAGMIVATMVLRPLLTFEIAKAAR